MATRWEARDVSEEGNERRGREQAHAGDRAQALDPHIFAGQLLELLLERADAPLEICDLARGLGEHRRGLPLGQEASELSAREASAFFHPSEPPRYGHLEQRFC